MKKEIVQAVLLTPMMLSTLPSVAIEFEHSYDHSVQTSEGYQTAAFPTAYCMSTSTFGGTQTFDFQGQPRDSDSDSDQSGDC